LRPHRLKISGYTGNPLFTPEAYRMIAEFTKGIPRNVNNFCFNALSLASALEKKIIDTDVTREVISDLDISKFISSAQPESPAFEPFTKLIPEMSPASARNQSEPETLTPSEAAAYMQEVVLKLKAWQRSFKKNAVGIGGNTESSTRATCDPL
jgi:hypothetical protein